MRALCCQLTPPPSPPKGICHTCKAGSVGHVRSGDPPPPPFTSQGIRHTSKAGSVGFVLSGDLNCKPASLEAALLRALLPGLRWG